MTFKEVAFFPCICFLANSGAAWEGMQSLIFKHWIHLPSPRHWGGCSPHLYLDSPSKIWFLQLKQAFVAIWGQTLNFSC